MSRILIYLFPALIDLAIASTAFVCSVRGAEMGWAPSQIAGLFAVWAVAYMFVCQLVARVVTPKNAPRLLMMSCMLLAALSLGYVVFPSPKSMYYLMAVQALGTGFFFAPFQVFMKSVNQAADKSVAYSAGLFLFAWSAGFAVGPFVAGFLWKHTNWQACHILNLCVEVATAVGVYYLRHHVDQPVARAPGRNTAAGEPLDYSRMPDLAWLGWLCGGVSLVAFALFRSLFPSSGAYYMLTKPEQGTVFFAASIAQAAMGLLLCRSRSWMYRPVPVIAFGLFGVLGLALLSRAGTAWAFGIAASCQGVYLGAFFFYLTFHSLIHPTKSARYVSINESIVGAANIAGALIGGQIADAFGMPAAYLAGAGVVLVGVVVQGVVHLRHRALVRELGKGHP